MAASRMEFDVSFGPSAQRPRETDDPFCVLLLADLGGTRALPRGERKALAVDIDGFESVFKRLAPQLTIKLDGMPVEVAFTSMEDFHPDHLYARLSPFNTLRKLREELADPAQFRRAAAALGLPLAATPGPAPTGAAADDIQRLLGRAPSLVPAADQWLRDIVAPHVLPNVAHEQRALLAAADAALGPLMRSVLHHPQFQALEATWRGLDRLVRGLELGESLRLFVLDVSRAEIEADLARHGAELSASALHQQLNVADRHYGLFVIDQSFSTTTDDAQALAKLGALAARAGAPLLAGGVDGPASVQWTALRTSPMAPWLGLAQPRLLQRLPYGAATEPIHSFAFEEMPTPREPGAYLWGHAALALVLLVGHAFEQDAWAMDVHSQLELDDLPSHIYTEDGEPQAQPCAEHLLSESAAAALAARGFMPLMAWRNRNAVRLLRWQSLADPPTALRGLGD